MKDSEYKSLQKRLDNIEVILSSYLSTKEIFGNYDHILNSYVKLIQLYLEYGKISPSLLFPEVKDPVSKNIIEILFRIKMGNVSQITEAIKNETGTASRTTVRKKILDLEKKGIVEYLGDKGNHYVISERIVKKWLELIGINIRNDQH